MKKYLKRIAIISFLSLITTTSNAQAQFQQKFAKVKWGPEIDIHNPKAEPEGLYGPFDNLFAELQYNGKHDPPSINFYDVNSLKLTKTINVAQYLPESKNKDFDIEDFLLLKHNMVLLLSQYNRETDTKNIYALKILFTGTADGKAKIIYKLNSKSKRKAPTLNFVVSQDSSDFLVAVNPYFKRYDKEKFEYILFDKDLEQQWDKQVALPFLDRNFGVENYQLSKNGNLYMIANISSRDKAIKKDKSRNAPRLADVYKIIAFFPAENRLQQYDLKLKNGYWIYDMNFKLSNNQKLIASGFYAVDKNHGIKGLFYLNYNTKNQEIENENLAPFSTAFLSQFMSDKRAEKGKTGLENFVFTFQKSLNDGSTIVLAEAQYITVVCHTNPQTGATYCTTYYHSDDIIAVKFNSSGNVDWIKRIPKAAASTSPSIRTCLYSAYYYDDKTKNTYVIYDDNFKNYVKPLKNEKHVRGIGGINKHTVTSIVRIDSKGNMEKKILFNAKNAKFYSIPNLNFGIKDGLIIEAVGHKKYRYAKITF